MAYTKWKAEYLTSLEKQPVLEESETVPSHQTKEEDEVPAGRRVPKKSLEWLKHAREVQKKREKIQITDIAQLNEEACMLWMENMAQKRGDLNSCSDASTAVEDSHMETFHEIVQDYEFMKFMGGTDALKQRLQDDPEKSDDPFNDLGGIIRGLIAGVMAGATPLMQIQAEMGRDKVVEMLREADLDPGKKAGLEELSDMYNDLLDGYRRYSEQDVIMEKWSLVKEKSTSLGVTQELADSMNLEKQKKALTKTMGNLGDECFLM